MSQEAQIFVQGHRVEDWRGRLPTRPDAEPYETRPLAAISTAVIHYSGVDADSSAESIAHYHVEKTDGDLFPAIAYHFNIRQTGLIEQCHDLITRSWHAGALANQTGIAICLPMLYGPTPSQAVACGQLITALGAKLGRILAVKGHKDYMATQCPGPLWHEWQRTVSPKYNADTRQLVVDGIPIKWAFLDCYRRLERLRPGLCGPPLAAHRALPSGEAAQEFAGCTMLWREQRLWVAFKPTPAET